MPRSRFPTTPPEDSIQSKDAAQVASAPATAHIPYARTASANPSEANALALAQAGDHHAFAQLYTLHKRRIYSLCLRMVGNMRRRRI